MDIYLFIFLSYKTFVFERHGKYWELKIHTESTGNIDLIFSAILFI